MKSEFPLCVLLETNSKSKHHREFLKSTHEMLFLNPPFITFWSLNTTRSNYGFNMLDAWPYQSSPVHTDSMGETLFFLLIFIFATYRHGCRNNEDKFHLKPLPTTLLTSLHNGYNLPTHNWTFVHVVKA